MDESIGGVVLTRFYKIGRGAGGRWGNIKALEYGAQKAGEDINSSPGRRVESVFLSLLQTPRRDFL